VDVWIMYRDGFSLMDKYPVFFQCPIGHSFFVRNVVLVLLLCLSGTTVFGSTMEQGDLENPSILKASEILPQSLRRGEFFQVEENVRSDGFWNIYTLQAGNINYHVHGTYLLSERIHEIYALAELKRVSELVLVGKGAIKSLVGTEEDLVQVGTHPVATVEGLSTGFSRILQKTKTSLGSLKEQNPTKAEQDPKPLLRKSFKIGKEFVGITAAEKAWYEKVGVDPYTPNQEIRKEIQRLALFEVSGQIFEKALVPIPRPIGLAASLSHLAYSEDSDALISRYLSRLEVITGDEALIKSFLENPFYSLSGKIVLIDALSILEDVPGRENFLLQASHADSHELATFFMLGADLLRKYHTEMETLIEVVPNTVTPAGLVKAGHADHIVFFYPVDHLFWTEEISSNILAADRIIRERYGDISILVRMNGSASERARKGFSELGWAVEENTVSYGIYTRPSDSGE
jgi:hypothetical protein